MQMNTTTVDAVGGIGGGGGATLHRKIGWAGAFWVASGVPALVLFSIGSIAATVGKPSWAVWIVSIAFGFLQSFSYAEIAGLFPHKSGAADAAINTWQITLLDLSAIKAGLSLRINATFMLGAAVLLVAFAIQHRGILQAARMQMVLGVAALAPLMLIGLWPLVSGDMPAANLAPLFPLAKDAGGAVIDGSWDMAGWTLIAGGLFMAAWSTYGFETAVCYTREFRDPRTDTFKAILYSGLLCIFVFTVVPLAFQGSIGLGQLVTPEVKDAAGNVVTPAVYDGILSPDIYSGMGVAHAMAHMLGGGALVEHVLMAMLVLALVLSIMTSMAGSSRTLYQASVDGWLPKYLSHVNANGAPIPAMWTDLGFNLLLLLMSDYVFVLAISNVCYILFNFLNLNAAWIHRIDRPGWPRPFKAPTWLIVIGTALAFVNLALMGMGADIWGAGTLATGLLAAAMILPVFFYRHYVQDKGQFPAAMQEDMHLGSEEGVGTRAGILPYVTLLGGAAVIYIAHSLAVL